MLFAITWAPLGIVPGAAPVRLGLFRAQKTPGWAARTESAAGLSRADADGILGSLRWGAWRDPGDAVVDFHREAFLGRRRRGPCVSMPPSFSFIRRIPIRGTERSDE
jgi:hypothetical protein